MSTFPQLWAELLPIGRTARGGGYRRFCWSPAELECRAWFEKAAAQRHLLVSPDRNGNLWAWWDPAAPGATFRASGKAAASGKAGRAATTSPAPATAIVCGSHLDSVPDGGAFDGPLGIVSAFAAIDQLRAEGFTPGRPIAVAAFSEEEGGRFGVACLGSKLLTGAIDPDTARGLRDGDGTSVAEAMQAAGHDAARLGRDDELLARIGTYLELHIEQGKGLAGLDAAVGIAEGIWPHGRWRLDFTGRPDHAGTAQLWDRADPVLPTATTILAARQAAAAHGSLATISKLITEPGAANAVAASVRAWLDVRGPDDRAVADTVRRVLMVAVDAADKQQVALISEQESASPAVTFDPALRTRLAASLGRHGMTAPELPTGAGHDAGVLAAEVPSGMLFVRNPTGVSHSPAEHAEAVDCEAGVLALTTVLRDLAAS